MSPPVDDEWEPGITVILNLYRRPEYLGAQVDAIRSQTVAPAAIWLWVNDHDANRELDLSACGCDRVFRNDHNWKYAGRFAAAMLARTQYVALFDDDTVPGPRWLENCLATMRTSPGILGTAGVVFTRATYDTEHYRYGWGRPCPGTVEVDFVGHAWFFERSWLKYFWLEPLSSWDTAEDMHLSFAAQKHGGIRTYCPPHPPGAPEWYGSVRGHELGADGRASGTLDPEAFFSARARCFDDYRRRGWRLRWRYAFWWLTLVGRPGTPALLRQVHQRLKRRLGFKG